MSSEAIRHLNAPLQVRSGLCHRGTDLGVRALSRFQPRGCAMSGYLDK
jgi:hypothetical protein